jgi:LCP family protein required for cell wall assembly
MPSAAARHVRRRWVPESFDESMRLILLSAVLPGSAQIRTRRGATVGRVALGGWLLLLLLGMVGCVLVLAGGRALVLALLVDPDVLVVARSLLVLVAAVWLGLMLHAIVLAAPWRWAGIHRVAATVTAVGVLLAGTLPMVLAQRYVGIQADLLDSVFRADDAVDDGDSYTEARRRDTPPDGRYNVLLLGGDGGDNRDGVRTDSIQVASVDWETGDVVLIGLPRNLEDAPFPEGSPMGRQFPDGFPDFIFGVYTYAQDNPQLFPGTGNPGAEAVMQTVSAITGLRIDSYMLVSLAGFQEVVEAIGGVTIRVSHPVPIGGKVENGVIVEYPSDYIEPGLRHLDGFETLWYARGRFGSDDYARMRRQRCLIGAIAQQANPQNVLVNFQQLAASTKALIETDVRQSELPGLVDLALDVRNAEITTLAFTPRNVDSADPDYADVRAQVATVIAESEADPTQQAAPDARADSTPSPTPGAGETGTETLSPDGSAGSPEPSDSETDIVEEPGSSLSDVCSYA